MSLEKSLQREFFRIVLIETPTIKLGELYKSIKNERYQVNRLSTGSFESIERYIDNIKPHAIFYNILERKYTNKCLMHFKDKRFGEGQSIYFPTQFPFMFEALDNEWLKHFLKLKHSDFFIYFNLIEAAHPLLECDQDPKLFILKQHTLLRRIINKEIFESKFIDDIKDTFLSFYDYWKNKRDTKPSVVSRAYDKVLDYFSGAYQILFEEDIRFVKRNPFKDFEKYSFGRFKEIPDNASQLLNLPVSKN